MAYVSSIAVRRLSGVVAAVGIAGILAWGTRTPAALFGRAEVAGLHYTVNQRGDYEQATEVGFNLADVSSVSALDALPDGVQGILWTRNGYDQTCAWQKDDESLAAMVREARDHPRFSHVYFISDTPHPSVCPDAPQRIAERTALIHRNDPEGKTFIAVSGGHKYQQEFMQLADAADLIGIVVYPCNFKKPDCQLEKIPERVNRALDAGIPPSRLVPVIQAFGQSCATNEEKYYRMPDDKDLRDILRIWDELLPREGRPFDMTYSWGQQQRHACPSLVDGDGVAYPDLQNILSGYFRETPS